MVRLRTVPQMPNCSFCLTSTQKYKKVVQFQNWYCSSFTLLISLYTSVYVVSRTLTTTYIGNCAAAFLPGNGQNATNNVYETAILDHLGPIAPKEIDVFSTTMAKLTIKPGGVAPTIISAKISIKVGC